MVGEYFSLMTESGDLVLHGLSQWLVTHLLLYRSHKGVVVSRHVCINCSCYDAIRFVGMMIQTG